MCPAQKQELKHHVCIEMCPASRQVAQAPRMHSNVHSIKEEAQVPSVRKRCAQH